MMLTAKQRRFCEEYIVDFNGTQAAIRAGYSVKTARVIAQENLLKPAIKDCIDEKMEELSLTAQQTTKLMADIARGSLNDYITVRQAERTRKIKKKLSVIIKELNDQIEFEQEYAFRVKLKGEDLKDHAQRVASLKRQIIRYEIELERNPKADRIVDSEPELVDSIEIDFIKLAKDKQYGRIKTLQWTEFGPKVELYSAEKMLTNIANMHGLFTNKHQFLDKNGEPTDPNAHDPLAPVALTINVIDRNADIQQAPEQGTVQQETDNA